MPASLQAAIQAELDESTPPQKIRESMSNVPFREWSRAYLDCTRRIPIITPWDEGTESEMGSILHTLRSMATREGMSHESAFFLVYEIVHGAPHPEA